MTDELVVRGDGAAMLSVRLDAGLVKRLDGVLSHRRDLTGLGIRRVTRSEIAREALLKGLALMESERTR